ncbi:hypothetical protein KIPB_006536 [Kipferlia bialata]|uniref:Uncharacterized protein n=1 Tax=Kipferlia bialata TaxID=797122 RepID=A0A9K3CX62_9EUKA|nr:hypothetical protein KIPB_006536 [Kipferlia bialata]|eukprot:g6536.t1
MSAGDGGLGPWEGRAGPGDEGVPQAGELEVYRFEAALSRNGVGSAAETREVLAAIGKRVSAYCQEYRRALRLPRASLTPLHMGKDIERSYSAGGSLLSPSGGVSPTKASIARERQVQKRIEAQREDARRESERERERQVVRINPTDVPQIVERMALEGVKNRHRARQVQIDEQARRARAVKQTPDILPTSRTLSKDLEALPTRSEGIIREHLNKVEALLAEKDRVEAEGLTFRPTINKKSRAVDRVDSEEWVGAHERKIQALRAQQEAEIDESCTFKPRINKSSRRLVRQRASSRAAQSNKAGGATSARVPGSGSAGATTDTPPGSSAKGPKGTKGKPMSQSRRQRELMARLASPPNQAQPPSLSHTPTINPVSKAMAERSQRRAGGDSTKPAAERLYNLGKQQQRKRMSGDGPRVEREERGDRGRPGTGRGGRERHPKSQSRSSRSVSMTPPTAISHGYAGRAVPMLVTQAEAMGIGFREDEAGAGWEESYEDYEGEREREREREASANTVEEREMPDDIMSILDMM